MEQPLISFSLSLSVPSSPFESLRVPSSPFESLPIPSNPFVFLSMAESTLGMTEAEEAVTGRMNNHHGKRHLSHV